MKIGNLFIVCLVIQQNTVGGQTLPELLKDAQSQTDELHSVVTSALLKVRVEMSNVLTRTVNECLLNILKPMEALQLSAVQNAIDEQTSEAETIGKQISRCAAKADHDIQAAIKQFFFVFTPIHSESLSVLNTLLEQIVEWNNTSNASAIVAALQNTLEVKSNEFLSNAVPLLQDELLRFKDALSVVTSDVSLCVGEKLTEQL